MTYSSTKARPHVFAVFAAVFLAVLVMLALHTPLDAQEATCNVASDLGGTVYRDYNSNGVRDTNEHGIAGIIVQAYDNANSSIATVTSESDGSYSFSNIALPVRIEFSGLAALALEPAFQGNDSKSATQRHTAASCSADFGVNVPADYCGTNDATDLVTSCYVFGEAIDSSVGANTTREAFVRFGETAGTTTLNDIAGADSPSASYVAAINQIGSVWGVAIDPLRGNIYTSAYLKRHTDYGPGGPGAIYQVDAAGNITELLNIGIDAGTDTHPQPTDICTDSADNSVGNAECWLYDEASYDHVSKMAFGDIDISADFSTLYAINLATRELLAIPLDAPTTYTATAIPAAACAGGAADSRPFGIGVELGTVYVGVTCSGETNLSDAQLSAHVLPYKNGAFAPSVLDIDLSTYHNWHAWESVATWDPSTKDHAKWSQPILSDIDFDGNDMILALRDRNADLLGDTARPPIATATGTISGISRGDVLRACGANGSWTLESNGTCGAITTGGAGNGYGPADGEYYWGAHQYVSPSDSMLKDKDTSFGSLVQIPGRPDVIMTSMNPIDDGTQVSDGGIKWLNNAGTAATTFAGAATIEAGTTSRIYRLYDGSSDPALFDKSAGLGDLEAICSAAPIQIGNYVWFDADGDGIQDPNETPISGVVINLLDADGEVVATATTDANGYYVFSTADGIEFKAMYTLQIDTSQSALVDLDYVLTTNDQGNDNHDSDGTLSGGYAVFTFMAGMPGQNNHTYDFGFIDSPLAVSVLSSDAGTNALSTNVGFAIVIGATTMLLITAYVLRSRKNVIG